MISFIFHINHSSKPSGKYSLLSKYIYRPNFQNYNNNNNNNNNNNIILFHDAAEYWRVELDNRLLASRPLLRREMKDHPVSLGVTYGEHVESPRLCWLSRPALPLGWHRTHTLTKNSSPVNWYKVIQVRFLHGIVLTNIMV